MATGYPTPNAQSGDVTYGCIPIFVPNNPEFQSAFAAAIYGLYGQMANEWFWTAQGTLSPQLAALYASYGLAQTEAYGECGDMSCEDVADCIETNEVTQDAIATAITNNTNIQNSTITVIGGLGNPNHVNPYLTTIPDRQPADFNETEIKELTACNLDKLWGGIRYGIVERLDENLQDTLQDIATIPTIVGRNTAWLDIVPVLGDLVEAVLNSLSSAAPSLLSLYESYSSNATKDELACELFALVCAECRYPTFEEIYNHFKNYGLPETPSIGDWVLDTMTQLLTNPVGVLSKVAYFTLMTWQLGILYIQAKFNGASGSDAIIKFATLGEDFASNNWFQLCETCNEAYGKVVYDFKASDCNTYFVPGFFGTNQWQRMAGSGFIVQEGQNAASIGLPLQSTWKVRSVAVVMSKAANQFTREVYLRPNVRNSAAQIGLNMSTNFGNRFCRDNLLDLTGNVELAVRVAPVTGAGTSYVEAIEIIYKMPDAPSGATPTNDTTLCD